jgi:5-methylcytosine-specific restriction protein B
LGQAYFWSVTDLAGLQQVFLYKVLPLLQTYCYDQWQPIRLIFNDHRKPVELQWIQQIDDEARVRQWLGDDVAVAIQPTYRINHAAFADIDSYRMML